MKSWKEIQQNVNIELLLGCWITGNSFLLLFYFIIFVFVCVFLFLFLIEIIVDIKYYVSFR